MYICAIDSLQLLELEPDYFSKKATPFQKGGELWKGTGGLGSSHVFKNPGQIEKEGNKQMFRVYSQD